MSGVRGLLRESGLLPDPIHLKDKGGRNGIAFEKDRLSTEDSIQDEKIRKVFPFIG
jgi:hypothetical protein